MATKATLGQKQKRMLQFLREHSGKLVSEADILAASDMKASSFRVNVGNGLYDRTLKKEGVNKFRVIAPESLDERAFHRQVSQTARNRELGASLSHPLAQKLLQKSRDNFILALELYNRPSLLNRLDAFSQLFCTSWEQLLKAQIIHNFGENEIYRPKREGRRRESIGLVKCVERIMGCESDPVAKNLLRIGEIRNAATHLLMPELAAPVGSIFQAGVINYARHFRSLSGEPVLPEGSAGLLSLVGPTPTAEAVDLRKLYGDIAARDILSLRDELNHEIETNNDERFAINVTYKVVLTKGESQGDISLTAAANDARVLRVVEKPVAASARYSLFFTEAKERIAERVRHPFTQHDLQQVLKWKKWKDSNNEFHHYEEKCKRHLYSPEFVDKVVEMIESDEGLLERLRKPREKPAAKNPRSEPKRH